MGRTAGDGVIPIASSPYTLHEGRQVREEGIGGGKLLRALCDLGVKALEFWYDGGPRHGLPVGRVIPNARDWLLPRKQIQAECYVLRIIHSEKREVSIRTCRSNIRPLERNRVGAERQRGRSRPRFRGAQARLPPPAQEADESGAARAVAERVRWFLVRLPRRRCGRRSGADHQNYPAGRVTWWYVRWAGPAGASDRQPSNSAGT